MSNSSSSGEESDTAVHDFDLEDRSSTPAVEVTNRGERDERDERDEADDHDDHDDESNPALRRLRAHQRRWKQRMGSNTTPATSPVAAPDVPEEPPQLTDALPNNGSAHHVQPRYAPRLTMAAPENADVGVDNSAQGPANPKSAKNKPTKKRPAKEPEESGADDTAQGPANPKSAKKKATKKHTAQEPEEPGAGDTSQELANNEKATMTVTHKRKKRAASEKDEADPEDGDDDKAPGKRKYQRKDTKDKSHANAVAIVDWLLKHQPDTIRQMFIDSLRANQGDSAEAIAAWVSENQPDTMRKLLIDSVRATLDEDK